MRSIFDVEEASFSNVFSPFSSVRFFPAKINMRLTLPTNLSANFPPLLLRNRKSHGGKLQRFLRVPPRPEVQPGGVAAVPGYSQVRSGRSGEGLLRGRRGCLCDEEVFEEVLLLLRRHNININIDDDDDDTYDECHHLAWEGS